MEYCFNCGSELINDDKCHVCGSRQQIDNVEYNIDDVQSTYNVIDALKAQKKILKQSQDYQEQ